MFGGETIGFELADTFAPFEVDLSEWVGKPVHEKQIGVSFPSTTVSQGSNMATAAWAGTITLSNLKGGSGGSSGGVSAGDKQKARDDANVQFEWLLIDCGIGGGATVFSGGPPAVTGTMQALAKVDCLFDVLTLIADSIVANDPPDADFRRIATAAASSRPALSLPSCRALAGNDRRVCTKLERAAHRLATRVKRVKDVATALATTGNRLSGALQGSAATAAKKQKRAFAKLRKKLDAALRARGTAGKAVAQVLRAANVSGRLNEAETAQAIDVALKDLSQQGLSESAARSLVGSAASPRAIDALAVLATP